MNNKRYFQYLSFFCYSVLRASLYFIINIINSHMCDNQNKQKKKGWFVYLDNLSFTKQHFQWEYLYIM